MEQKEEEQKLKAEKDEKIRFDIFDCKIKYVRDKTVFNRQYFC